MSCRAFVLGFVIALACPVAGAADPEPAPSAGPITLESVIAEVTKLLAESKTPGLSLAIVTRDEVLFTGGFGLADVARQIPATADTRFRIGSTSKAFTALAVLQLQAEGRLDLNATLASLAPEIEFQNRWEETDPVRLVHLLEHTTGFDDIHLRDYANQDPRPNNLRDALAHDPDSRRCRWRPGTRFAYCNAGPPIAAYVIEKITGVVFEDHVQRALFAPLGMTTATYFRPEGDTDLAQLYARDGVTPFDYWHISMRPSGAINASAHDMAAYIRFYLHRGRVGEAAIVSEEAIRRMEQPQTSTAARAGLTVGYGLYNYAVPDDEGRLWHGHGGGVQGGLCDMSYLPEGGVGYAIMINSGDGGTLRKSARAVRRFLTQDLAKPELPPPVPIADDIATRYDGFYVPVSPRVQISAGVERVAGVARLRFIDGEATFGGIFGGKQSYVGVSPTLLRRKNQALATLVLLEPGEKDNASLVVHGTSFRRVAVIIAFAPLALHLVAAVTVVSTLAFLPVWLVRGAWKKIRLREHLGLRLWPLAASLALVWFVAAALAMARDPQIFQNYGHATARSIALAASGIVALIVAWWGLFAVWRMRLQAPHRWLYRHALLVLATLSALTLYLTLTGLIPLVTWG